MESPNMSNLSWGPRTSDGYDDPPEQGLDRYDPCEIDPQLFTRLGLLLMIALAFGLVAELLVRLPLH
jgi:hypothetical protein